MPPGAQDNGELHQGSSPTKVYPPFHLSGRLKRLLRGQEGQRLAALHWLLDPQCLHSQTPLSISSGPGCARGSPWGSHLLEAEPAECVQPRSYQGGRRVEDWIHKSLRSLRVQGYAAWPFELTVSLPGFMNEVFREFLHQFVIVYIDDILFYSWNLAEHRHHVTNNEQLRKHYLYLKFEKWDFHCPMVQFLGYIDNADGIQIDQGKVQAICDWPQPQSVKELQRFLGFANFYRRFIQNFSFLSAPLTAMLSQKPKPLSWNPEARATFQKLQEAFCNAPIPSCFLWKWTAPPPEWEQCCPNTMESLLVSILVLSSPGSFPRRRAQLQHRELLAIKLALEEWHHWLEGAQHPFSVITNHKNL